MLLEKLGVVGFLSAIKAAGALAFVVPAMALRRPGIDDAPDAVGAATLRLPPAGHDLSSARENEAVRRIIAASAEPAARIHALHDAARVGIDEAERAIAQLRLDLADIAVAR